MPGWKATMPRVSRLATSELPVMFHWLMPSIRMASTLVAIPVQLALFCRLTLVELLFTRVAWFPVGA
ncbi:hypothetical protein D3C78_1428570 [compost metagenome]